MMTYPCDVPVTRASLCRHLCMLWQAQGPRETGTDKSMNGGTWMSYLVQSPCGVSEEGDAVSLSHTDGHSSETGSRRLPSGFSLHWCSACHWTGGVVGAAGICLKGVLQQTTATERPVS